MTTRSEIRTWLDSAPADATHMLVVVDTFDYGNYPAYTSNVDAKLAYFQSASMQRVMEVYNLSIDFSKQLNEHRSWNF